MLSSLIVCGVDPALSNLGLSRARYHLQSGLVEPLAVSLTHTENQAAKTVRKNSDDLRRAGESFAALHQWIAGASVVFAEVPTGSQSARGSFSNGVCCGVLSSIGNLPSASGVAQPRMIQVLPHEVKLAAVGSKHATKQEMIDWATAKAPDLEWIKYRGKITAANEHPADALAAIYAGIKTEEFKRLVDMLRILRSQPSPSTGDLLVKN